MSINQVSNSNNNSMHNESNITTPFPLILARLKNTHIVIKQLVNDLHRIQHPRQQPTNNSFPSRPKSTTTLSRNHSGRYKKNPYPEQKFNKIPAVKISSSPIQIRTTPINIIKNSVNNNNTASSLSNSPETSDSESDENETENRRHKQFKTLQKMDLSEELISCIMGCCNRVNNANNDPSDRRPSNPLENSTQNIECRFLQAEKSLEWCVKQLTQLSIHKSLGAMANEKYKEIIRQEFDKKEHSSSVTEFITSTFFERTTEKQEKTLHITDENIKITKNSFEKDIISGAPIITVLPENKHFEKKTSLPTIIRPMPVVDEKENTQQQQNFFNDKSESDHSNNNNRYLVTKPHLSKTSSLASIQSNSNSLPPALTDENNSNNSTSSLLTSKTLHIRPENEHEINKTEEIIENIKIQNSKNNKRALGPKLIENHVTYCKSLKSVPKFQTELVMSMDEWNGVDIFNLTELTRGRPMTTLFWAIMEKKDENDVKFMSHFKFNKRKLLCWLLHIEDHYRDLPYHNRSHSADVLHSTYVLLNFESMKGVFDKVE